jgi:hypothetical protein
VHRDDRSHRRSRLFHDRRSSTRRAAGAETRGLTNGGGFTAFTRCQLSRARRPAAAQKQKAHAFRLGD